MPLLKTAEPALELKRKCNKFQNINGVWIELLQADLVFEESKDANLTVLNKDSVEISIQGFAKFMPVD